MTVGYRREESTRAAGRHGLAEPARTPPAYVPVPGSRRQRGMQSRTPDERTLKDSLTVVGGWADGPARGPPPRQEPATLSRVECGSRNTRSGVTRTPRQVRRRRM